MAALRRRPSLYLGVVAAGALIANVVLSSAPAEQADASAAASQPASVAQQLGLSADPASLDTERSIAALQDMAASRSTREDQQTAAQQVQAAADQAVLDAQAAEAAAAAAAQAEAAAAAEAEAAAAAEAAASSPSSSSAGSGAVTASSSTSASSVARISNTSGPVASSVRAAADAVVSNVPGAGSITLGGTRPSATDPGGHPSGRALDYMVMTDQSLGDAIVAYHIAHWDELGVDYLIYEQRYLGSPNGSWSMMEDRGGTTANHFDHVHVNYR
ncbi:hypothetical protein ASG36_16380 [Geodermatophilus sp. Leaf369]|nr:hypothetical protein ASG36_16380 [Geodermatophilus sp. Leaf369]